jgi:hypothetical protein
MTHARLAGVVLVALGALGALAAGCKEDEGPATGLDVGVDISEPYSKLGSLRVTARTTNGFMAMEPTQMAPGVTAQVENDVLAVTFTPPYAFATTVQFLLAIETAAPLDVILQAEVRDASDGTIALSPEVTKTVTPGLRTPALLTTPCLVAGSCDARDGGMLLIPSADEAAAFYLLGGQLGSSLQSAVVTQITQVAVCHFGAASDPADLVVGVPQAQDYYGQVNRGRVLIYRGQGRSWSGTLPLDAPDMMIIGATNAEQAGTSVACADFDGDGHDELVISAPTVSLPAPDGGVPGHDGGLGQAGRVYVLYDVATFAAGALVELNKVLAGDAGLNGMALIEGQLPQERIGQSLATPRLSYGRPWLAIGAPGDGSVPGRVYLLPPGSFGRGGSQHVGSDGLIVDGPQATARFGFALAAGALTVSGASDHDDLVVSAPKATGPGTAVGAVYVFAASRLQEVIDAGTIPDGGLVTLDNWVTIWGPPNDQFEPGFGEALAVGDIDQDDYRDLAIGTPRAKFAGKDRAGAVYLLKGGTAFFQTPVIDLGVTPTPALRSLIGGPLHGGTFGATVVAVPNSGSVSSPRANLWIGAPGVEDDRGLVILLEGRSTMDTTEDTYASTLVTFQVLGTAAGDRLGECLAAGILDGNLTADLVAVAPKAMNGTAQAGAAYGFLDQKAK